MKTIAFYAKFSETIKKLWEIRKSRHVIAFDKAFQAHKQFSGIFITPCNISCNKI